MEMEVLGFCLTAKNPITKLHEAELTPQDFAWPLHGQIFDILHSQFQKLERANPVALSRQLAKDKAYVDAGGQLYLAALRDKFQGEREAILAAQTVKGLSQRRKLILGLTESFFKALDLAAPVKDAVAICHQAVADTVSQTEAKRIVPQLQVVQETLGEIDRLIQGAGKPIGLSTGIDSLDRSTAGLCNGDYYILAARPGMGKTALGMQIAANVASNKHPVLFFSLEMPRSDLMKRLISARLTIDYSKFRGIGQFTTEEQERMAGREVDALAKLPIHYYDFSRIQAHELRTLVYVAREQFGAALIVLDYIGLVKPDIRTKQRYIDVGEISATIRETAKDLKLPVLALCQMNRRIDGAKESEPQLSDLRESGNLEQDAAAVMFLYEKEDDNLPDLKRIMLKLAKNRHGPQCTIPLAMETRFLRFREVEQEYRVRPGENREHWQDQQ